MEVKLISSDKPTQIVVAGRVDTTTAGAFQKEMESLMAQYPQDLVLNCAELTYLSSIGLRSFFMLARQAKASNITITLKAVAKNVREVLKISGFDSFFTIVD